MKRDQKRPQVGNNAGRTSLLLLALGLTTAAFFCFLIYPRLQGSYQVHLDPDDYARIAKNLGQGHGLSYGPEFGPMLYRGPGYPAFLAGLLWLSKGAYPAVVWWAQSLLHGGTAVVLFWMGREHFGHRIGLITGVLAALYPVLFWYTPRMWNDSALAFLVTLVFFLITRMARRPHLGTAAAVGAILGVLCLIKGTFLPWMLVIPAWLSLRFRAPRSIWIIPVIACLFIVPWSWRNYQLVGEWVPIHTGAAFNLVIGNELAADFADAPLAYDDLWVANIDSVLAMTSVLTSRGAVRDLEKEEIYREVARHQLRDPKLWAQKILFAGTSFWYIGQSPAKTILLAVLRGPVLLLAPFGWWLYRRRGGRTLEVAGVLTVLFWASHLPFAPPVRLSLPLMPFLLLLAVFAVDDWRRRRQGDSTAFPGATLDADAYADPEDKGAAKL